MRGPLVAIHQPNYLPWLGWFAKAARADVLVLLDDVQFEKGGWTNRVEVRTAGLTQAGEVRTNSSFESASDPRLHFGLGNANKVDSIVVHWPSGKTDTVLNQAADQEVVVVEGQGSRAPGNPAGRGGD